ncbi:MAG: hypothetical protein PHW96_01765 [Candidatus Nanoarchaeia archaeon]|nr:hypothetical protein [Candidatus Nanoarchaeia archaeon]
MVKLYLVSVAFVAIALALVYTTSVVIRENTALGPIMFGLIYLASFVYFIYAISRIKKVKA